MDSAELAELRVLSLINDETAVALNYAMTRQFEPTPQYHIIFDMGAGSTVASLVEFKNVQKKSGYQKKNITRIHVRAMGYDRTLGGHQLDKIIRDKLVLSFREIHGKKIDGDITDNPRAMGKLLKEASRVKLILSANAECRASVEGLIDDIDFQSTVKRSELEESSLDFLDRLGGPIKTVLKKSGLALSEIQSFILAGGSIRVPMIQAKLQEIVGEDKIAKHVNADEAATLGATLLGAVMSPQFRVRDFVVKDIVHFPIYYSLDSDLVSTSSEEPVESFKLFSSNSTLNSKKGLKFNTSSDLSFSIKYDDVEDPEFGPLDLVKVKVAGVADIMKQEEHTEKSNSQVKIRARITNSGLLNFENSRIEFLSKKNKDSVAGSIKDTVMSFFGGSKKEEDGETESESDETLAEEAAKSAQETRDNSENSTSSQKNETEQVEEKPKEKLEKIALKLETEDTGIKSMSEKEKNSAMEKSKALDLMDRKRKEREESRNQLEAFVYDTTEFLDGNQAQEVTTEDERSSFIQKLTEESSWLYDDGDSPDTLTEEFQRRLKDLKAIKDPIIQRAQELEKRPVAIEKLRNIMEAATEYLEKHKSWFETEDSKAKEEGDSTEVSTLLSKSNFEDLEQRIKDLNTWFKDVKAKQDALEPSEMPVLKSKALDGRRLDLEYDLTSLKNKVRAYIKELAEKKKSKSAASASATESATSTAEMPSPTMTGDNETEFPAHEQTSVPESTLSSENPAPESTIEVESPDPGHEEL